MILSDSHCHLHMIDAEKIGADLNQILNNAKENGVQYLLCVGTILEDLDEMLRISESIQNGNMGSGLGLDVKVSLGLHPNEPTLQEPTVDTLVALAKHPHIVAIGETGLDYYRNEQNESNEHEEDGKKRQQARFRKHIQAALITKKPLIIHTRQARADTIKILKEENAQDVGGVFHCFTEDWDTAQKAMDLGFYVSFSGIVTFKNALEIQEVAKALPLSSMLIETDAPFLAPNPHRGKVNQPSFVKHTAEFLANLKGISLEALAEATTANYQKLFGVAAI